MEKNTITLSKEEYDKLMEMKNEIENDKISVSEYSNRSRFPRFTRIMSYYTKDELLSTMAEDKRLLIEKLYMKDNEIKKLEDEL